MWILEELPDFEQMLSADQLWLIALAVEENSGPRAYVLALRRLAERLANLGWWLETTCRT